MRKFETLEKAADSRYAHFDVSFPCAAVLNFYAPWCPWCQRLEPTWEAVTAEVHKRYPEHDGRIRFGKVGARNNAKLLSPGFPGRGGALQDIKQDAPVSREADGASTLLSLSTAAGCSQQLATAAPQRRSADTRT